MIERRERVMSSPYMQWAKTHLQSRFNLASSGLTNYPLSKLPVKIEDLELSGPSFYGYEPLQKALAAKCNVAPECVVAATGTSMANHLVMAALIEPGDEVLIEQPTYELLIAAAQYLGAEVKRFERTAERDFKIDAEEVARSVTERTRLIVLTNLHNPTSTFTSNETLKEIGEIARRTGARILVDEVYLEALFETAPPSAFHLGEEFITTNSLTKVYGLSGLRCGWILAKPELAERLWHLNDLFGVIPAHSAERLSCIALANLDEVSAHARGLLETNREILNSFYETRSDLDWSEMKYGTVSFPRLRSGSVDALCALLVEKYETSVVPGRFFENRQHFRIGIGCETVMLKEGLERLGKALNEIAECGFRIAD
ncbi:MAG TPA: aminotransferase class I/II-fold pyridoxal phosphate-dependent enzyme [Pyrinomonadaceae bacterium]|nr:aminotransferase class I/II-fold pyridoxal phosphate-dependent enzyme [Pyrinomonadaceae bacterium]